MIKFLENEIKVQLSCRALFIRLKVKIRPNARAPDVAFAIIMNLNVKSRTKSSLASMMTKKGKEASFPHSFNNSLAENRGLICSF